MQNALTIGRFAGQKTNKIFNKKPQMFNPLVHKKPYGATAVNKETTFTFPLLKSLGIKRVFVVLRFDDKVVRQELPLSHSTESEDIFVGKVVLYDSGIWHYRFEGEYVDGTFAFFGRDVDGSAIKGDWLPEWQLTVSKVDYKTPNWLKRGVIYQIFPDRFCKVGSREFAKRGRFHTNWYDRPDYAREGVDYRADDFFGGNVEGVISKLDYLKSLGMSSIYFCPIFESMSNHRYDTGDYLKIDGLFGDEESFATLIKKAEEKGIGIILDGVFNHTGSDSIYFNKHGNYNSLGAYQSKESPYYDWFYFDQFPDKYGCWWGSQVVPTVNKSAEGYRNLILGQKGVIEKWTKMGVKGWRLDVVDELPIDFTTDLCQKIKSVNPDCAIIGEVWEDASTKVAYSEWRPYFMGEQLDGVMNYPFKESILSYVLGGNALDFVGNVTRILENYLKESLDSCMTLVGSHDTARILTVLAGVYAPHTKEERAKFTLDGDLYDRAKARLKFASTLQYVLPGVPCLYYGDEAGVYGYEDPLNRGTYPWGREDLDLVKHYQTIGALRKEYEDFFLGETTFENLSDFGFDLVRRCDKGELRMKVKGDQATTLVNGQEVFSIE
jgi:glycosidase